MDIELKISRFKVLHRAFNWQTETFCVWLVCLILGLSQVLVAGQTVSVYIDQPRGGFGDTAANLLMIERLSAYYQNSGTQLSVIYSPEAKEQIHILWPEFSLDKDRQIVRGIMFTDFTNHTPADINLAFSIKGYAHAKSRGKLNIDYLEYSDIDSDHQLLGMTFKEVQDTENLKTPFLHPTWRKTGTDYYFNTGVSHGLYVMDGFRPDDFKKELTFYFLRKFDPKIEFSEQAKLGYAYASSPELVQQYVTAAETYAEKYQIEIVVVANHPVQSSSPLIKVISSKNIPFNLNQKIIKSSDLPILVTGDGSLSLAIEGRKPFFYSLYAWKRFVPINLKKAIEKASPALKKDKKRLDLVANLLSLDNSGQTSYENMFLQLMEDQPLQQELSRVFDGFVKQDSLVNAIQKDIQILNNFKTGAYLSMASVRLFWKIARSTGTLEQAIKKTERIIFESRTDPRKRLAHFVSLLDLHNYTEDRVAKLLSKMLEHGDFNLKFALRYFIQDAYKGLNLVTFFPQLTAPAQAEVTSILKNLALQSNQWSPFNQNAERYLGELGKASCLQFYK